MLTIHQILLCGWAENSCSVLVKHNNPVSFCELGNKSYSSSVYEFKNKLCNIFPAGLCLNFFNNFI